MKLLTSIFNSEIIDFVIATLFIVTVLVTVFHSTTLGFFSAFFMAIFAFIMGCRFSSL